MRASSLLAVLALAAPLVACGGSIETVGRGTGTAPAAPFLTPLPTGSENPDALFVTADGAFRSGDFVRAHRDFGTLFIVAPDYGGNIPADALAQTCVRLGIDCTLSTRRLEIIRDAYWGTFGPRNAWPAEQARDFDAIVACYDRALVGDLDGAIAAGGPVTQAPLDGFRHYANECVGPASAQRDAFLRQQAVDRAFEAWFGNYECFADGYEVLIAAFDAGDWDAFARAWPAYQRCAGPVDEVVSTGVLDGDPRIADQLDFAWAAIGEINTIAGANQALIASVQASLASLDADPNYAAARAEYDRIAADETRQLQQIASIEAVAASLDPSARGPIDAQIAQEYGTLNAIRAALAQAMGQINAIRAYYGLPPRDRP